MNSLTCLNPFSCGRKERTWRDGLPAQVSADRPEPARRFSIARLSKPPLKWPAGIGLETRNRTDSKSSLRFLLAITLLGLPTILFAQPLALPLEIHQPDTLWNFQSVRGVPITTNVNPAIGSDGRMTNYNESGSFLLPTTNQFASMVGFGATPGLLFNDWLSASNSTILKSGTNAFSSATAIAMNLPRALSNSVIVMVLRRAQVGVPFLSRQISFPFGSVIDVPLTDENGLTLTNIASSAYWLPEPYTTNGHSNSGYYWSPNARKVYAIQPGPITVRWIKAAYSGTQPADYSTNAANYYTNAGNYFRIYSANYVVSGSPVKTPRRMYWTERGFARLGKPIVIPSARVGAVAFAYNNNFPETVAQEYVGPGDTDPTAGTTNQPLPELRTLWYDQIQGSLFAYNQEGRAFLELLGDVHPDGTTRDQLGYEIVDVFKQPTPENVLIELGDRVTPPDPDDLDTLSPEPVLQVGTPTFDYQHNVGGSDALEIFAIRETSNDNDYLIHWMETGMVGLKWPAVFARYQFSWPTDVARYSHYVRPLVATEAEAQLTAVQLSTENVPTIAYQDPLDQPRAKLTDDFKFYTFLDLSHPVHRTLLRYNAEDHVAFERVFSWLDVNLKSGSFNGNDIVASLDAWDPTNNVLNFPDPLVAPRVVYDTIDVGERIAAPSGEAGSDPNANYWAGHIYAPAGTSYNLNAYADPFVVGFSNANVGAIIPVNAIPGSNTLEVWWFRPNQADATQGFVTNYWPSVIGHYTLQWPTSPLEIVLASKLGSEGNGPLNSFQAVGQIYTQNDPSLPGYNPNEEHAIMSGGTAFATRDDLNITNAAGYSSQPFVLLQYIDADGRPAMTPFKVLREKPSVGWVFDYITEAGRLLQAPMPLPLLAKPTEGSGDATISYNSEPTAGTNDLPIGWDPNSSPSGPFGQYGQFTFRDRHQDYWVYRGLHAGLPALRVGNYNKNTRVFNNFATATAIVGTPFSLTLHASRQAEFLAITSTNLPAWLTASGLTISGTPGTNDISTNSVPLIVSDLYDGSLWTNTVSLRVQATGAVVTLAPLFLTSTNNYTGSIVNFSNRPPFLGQSPVSSNSFTMRFYYKTEPEFAWPGVVSPPPAGSIVPYLLPMSNGIPIGDPTSKTTPALDIVYRPAWPERDPSDSTKPLPTVPYGFTLTKPANGLPGVRDWKTASVLYQESIGLNLTNARVSVVLHDPTREKSASITDYGMQQIPASVRTEVFQGKTYFPNLPPHLGKRLFFDPTVGPKGSLVLKGEFKDEIVGADYLQLNVLRDSDLAAAKALCPTNDTVNSGNWASAIVGLATSLETFYENPAVPGTYIPNPALTDSVGVGDLAEVPSDNTAVDSYALSATGPGAGYITLVEANGTAFTQPGDPVALHVLKIGGSINSGELKVIPAENPLSELVTFQHSPDLAGRFTEYEYDWKIAAPVDGLPPAADPTNSVWLSLQSGTNLPRYVLGGAGVQVLGDNYVTVRYRPKNPAHPLFNVWSAWTTPQLAEGWIKRVLAGINPFNQRTTDLFNNAVNTDVSLLTQAGHRWEGDVALNLDTINSYGLIEIYETILRRGRSLSIESGYNYGPANDALLLAAGYLSDLYMVIGNEAWADAANPTIGIGTADNTYGDIATALFSFKGQVPSLLEEELALLRGRDDSLLPGVQTPPVYNRLVWNYTRGIDSGEVIYALNYNIQENPNHTPDGIINAADAAYMFPQGHGDAYGHYLTALKGYYSLLLNNYFDWVPRIEAVTVLGQPVSVDYQDERKFATAAAAVARAGRQVFDLTWRRDYQAGHDNGWSYFSTTRLNANRTVPTTRYWGMDHWASRVGEGGYINWVTGNAILPAVDPNPLHEGIQKIDRTTVPELTELATMAADLQTAMDNAEGGLTPLGLPQDSVALDINPNVVVGTDNGTHFEQIYSRAKVTLNNAVAAFDDAKDVTRLMRSEQDSLADFQAGVARQELTYSNALIELYGTPYSDDIGPNGIYNQGYAGPDLIHFAYVDPMPLEGLSLISNAQTSVFKIDVQNFPASFDTTQTESDGFNSARAKFDFVRLALANSADAYRPGLDYVPFALDDSGVVTRPDNWTGRRASPGKLQEAISRIQLARNAALGALSGHEALKRKLDRSLEYFQAKESELDFLNGWSVEQAETQTAIESAKFVAQMVELFYQNVLGGFESATATALKSIPDSQIYGTAVGGDIFAPARASILASAAVYRTQHDAAEFLRKFAVGSFTTAKEGYLRIRDAEVIQPLIRNLDTQKEVLDFDDALVELQQTLFTMNQRLQELNDTVRNYQSLVAQGDRLQQERQVYRQRASAVIQGYRTRDAAFRSFRNEKLERYKTLFDLAARYAFLSANAYDYETGLLNTSAGRSFVNRIISARALGVVRDGEPQYAGSDTGDPGLSSALAEMKADWDVVKGRLSFNNPDAYGTTVSLRTENFRILPTTNSDSAWKDLLQQNRLRDVLADDDVRRFCMQLSRGDGLPVPGIVIEFSTTIANGYNLFGQQLAAGDHAYSPSSFATKIFGVGVALEGYRGMDEPSTTTGTGGTSPSDPNTSYLDPLALAATPYVYLVPVGVDSMRSPPLGDDDTIRSWQVQDVAVPLPFNIGASQLANGGLYESANSLSEPLFTLRKHQAFRPVGDASLFSTSLYGVSGTLQRSQFTNNRLIGRSVWNSRWKLVIPGHTLLNDPDEGLERFIATVRDIKLHFVTYSYSGN